MENLLSRLGSFILLEKQAKNVNKQIKRNAKKNKIANPRFFNLEELKTLPEKILNKSFTFDLLRAKTIPKPGKTKRRPLSIPTPRDRVVYGVLNRLLKPALIGYLNQAPSYGILKKRGVHGAYTEIKKHLADGCHYVLKVDIQDFFNKIDKGILSFILFPRIANTADSSINHLIRDCLKFEYKSLPEEEELRKLFPTKYYGIAQGNALSPLFADVYLKLFDSELKRSGFKVVRYVDDLIVFTKTKKELYPAYIKIKNCLKPLKLTIDKYNTGKCIATDITRHVEFLGVDIGPGQILTIQGNRVQALRSKLSALLDRFYNKRFVHISYKEKMDGINGLIEGWAGAYSMCDRAYLADLYEKLNKMINSNIDSLLNRGLIVQKEHDYLFNNVRRFHLPTGKKRKITRKKKSRYSYGVKPSKGQLKIWSGGIYNLRVNVLY